MLAAELPHGGERDARVFTRCHADPAGARLAGGGAVARGPAGIRQRLLEEADVLREHDPALVAVVHAPPDEHGLARAQTGGRRLERLRKYRDLDGTVHVLEGEECHAIAALRGRLFEPDGVAEEDDARAMPFGGQVSGRREAERLCDLPAPGPRTARDL